MNVVRYIFNRFLKEFSIFSRQLLQNECCYIISKTISYIRFKKNETQQLLQSYWASLDGEEIELTTGVSGISGL
jgi:hypothetical protein